MDMAISISLHLHSLTFIGKGLKKYFQGPVSEQHRKIYNAYFLEI